MDDIVLEKNYSNILFKTSFLFGLNTIYGFYQYFNNKLHFNDVLLTNTLLFITSVNYWRNPVYGFRRKIDMMMAVTNIFYNTYTISNYPNAWISYFSIKMIIITYWLSWKYHLNGNKELGTFYHSLVHVFGNIGNYNILRMESY